MDHLENPRVEAAEHYYNVTHTGLEGLGLKPHLLSDTLIDSMFDIVEAHKHHADVSQLFPRVQRKRLVNS